MRDPARIDRIMKLLTLAWKAPGTEDQRLGQLLNNVHRVAAGDGGAPIWNTDDDRWEEALATIVLRGWTEALATKPEPRDGVPMTCATCAQLCSASDEGECWICYDERQS